MRPDRTAHDQAELTRRVKDAQRRLHEELAAYTRRFGPFFSEVVAPVLSKAQLEGCRVVPNRFDLLDQLPKNAVVAEIGTYRGDFAAKILERADPAALHIFDIDWSNFQRPPFEEGIRSGRITLHDGDAAKLLQDFPEGMFDWIYIDADHSYAGVKRDIAACVARLKHEGILVFNDYTVWSVQQGLEYGVARAVNEFCHADGWRFTHFALNPLMYCDVAIERITAGSTDSFIRRVHRARMKLDAGHAAEASRLIIDALAQWPDVDGPTAGTGFGILELAWEQLQDRTTAERSIEQLEARFADHADFQVLAGVLACHLGDRDAGRARLERARSIDPAHARATELLREWFG